MINVLNVVVQISTAKVVFGIVMIAEKNGKEDNMDLDKLRQLSQQGQNDIEKSIIKTKIVFNKIFLYVMLPLGASQTNMNI